MATHIVDIAVEETDCELVSEQIDAAREIVNLLGRANLDINEAAKVLDFCNCAIL